MSTEHEIIAKLLADVPLSDIEFSEIVGWARGCLKDECEKCPINTYINKLTCAEFFAKFIYANAFRFGGNLNDKTALNELANNCIKICNEIKIKTKRETPMQVVVSHSNGKTIYHCYNCGKPLFVQPSTQYCECCGQKLSFEVVENEI